MKVTKKDIEMVRRYCDIKNIGYEYDPNKEFYVINWLFQGRIMDILIPLDEESAPPDTAVIYEAERYFKAKGKRFNKYVESQGLSYTWPESTNTLLVAKEYEVKL